ncbi:hypothetical protein AB0L05_38820 [Nonomuraea pusilla]|uniref:hypothetical protein n=1 Tax=Nonomuraea pusilla TaxID=46177 RepID=UPI003320DC88
MPGASATRARLRRGLDVRAGSAAPGADVVCDLSDPANPGSEAGGPYTLTGPESLTFAEQIEILGRVLGREIPIRRIGREEWKAENAAHIPERYADALLDWWESCDGRPAQLTGAVEELTGHPARTFATWAADHAAAFAARPTGPA